MADPYEQIDGMDPEQILEQMRHSPDSNYANYFLVAARIRSNRELTEALKEASRDSTKIGNRLIGLTCVIAAIGALQALATYYS